MISIYKIKPTFQKLLFPILRFLHQRGVTANQITWASILLSIGIGICFWYAQQFHWLLLTLPLGLFTRMALNALDGMMARTYNQQSKQGELLNELGDVVSDVFIYFPLLKLEPQSAYLTVIFIGLSIINEFTGLLGKVVINERRYDGPMGKSDRAFVVGLYGLLTFFNVNLSPFFNWIMGTILLLLLIGTTIRLTQILKKL